MKALKILTIFLLVIVSILLIELICRVISPQEMLHPGYQYSKEFKNVLPKESMIKHTFGFFVEPVVYLTDSNGFRNSAFKKKTVLLGDSYTFGIGVDEGLQWAAYIDDCYNLGMGGWTIEQQIKALDSFGYDGVERVVLMFYKNDVMDLSYTPSEPTMTEKRINDLLQYSHVYVKIKKAVLYNKRMRIYKKEVNQEFLYIWYLRSLIRKLDEKGITLYFLAVDEIKDNRVVSQIDEFQDIKRFLYAFERCGEVKYIRTTDWFKVEDLQCSQVSKWHYGVVWNEIMGNKLNTILNKTEYDKN